MNAFAPGRFGFRASASSSVDATGGEAQGQGTRENLHGGEIYQTNVSETNVLLPAKHANGACPSWTQQPSDQLAHGRHRPVIVSIAAIPLDGRTTSNGGGWRLDAARSVFHLLCHPKTIRKPRKLAGPRPSRPQRVRSQTRFGKVQAFRTARSCCAQDGRAPFVCSYAASASSVIHSFGSVESHPTGVTPSGTPTLCDISG